MKYNYKNKFKNLKIFFFLKKKASINGDSAVSEERPVVKRSAEQRAEDVVKFRKSGVLPLATSRVQTQSRAVIDNQKALKLNWYWWVRHFRVAGYTIAFAT